MQAIHAFIFMLWASTSGERTAAVHLMSKNNSSSAISALTEGNLRGNLMVFFTFGLCSFSVDMVESVGRQPLEACMRACTDEDRCLAADIAGSDGECRIFVGSDLKPSADAQRSKRSENSRGPDMCFKKAQRSIVDFPSGGQSAEGGCTPVLDSLNQGMSPRRGPLGCPSMPGVACALGAENGSITNILNSLSALSADTTRDIMSKASIKLNPGNRVLGETAKQAIFFPTVKFLVPALTNPALAFTATVFAAVVGGNFFVEASGSDGMGALGKKILDEVTGMIKNSHAEFQHARTQGYLQDLAEDLTWVLPMLCKASGETEGVWLTYFVILSHDLGTRQSELFGPACVRDMTVGDKVSKECEAIVQGKVNAVGDSTLIIGTLYAVLHLNVLSEVGRIEPQYAPDIAERIVNIGIRYLRLLRHLYTQYRKTRLASISNIKVECKASMDYPAEAFPTCVGIHIQTSGGWDSYASIDIVASPSCNQVHTWIDWDQENYPAFVTNGHFENEGCEVYNTPENNRGAILQECVDKYRKDVQLALAAMAERIAALATMVRAANELVALPDWRYASLYEPLEV